MGKQSRLRREVRLEQENEERMARAVSSSGNQLATATGNGHAPAPVLELPPPQNAQEVVARVGEIVERAQTSVSKQPRFNSKNPNVIFNSLFRWTNSLKEPKEGASIATWDAWYRDLVTTPGGEPHIAGTFASIVGIDKNRHYTVTGGRNQVNRVLELLQSAVSGDNQRGWRQYVTWQSTAFWSTRMGALTELGREGELGPVRRLYSVDPARAELTGEIEFPLKYSPSQGAVQKWMTQDFFRVASMGSTDEGKYGLGFPFVARALDLTRIMVAVWQHDKEMLGARAPKGLLLLNGITEEQWDIAMQARAEKLDGLEREYFGGVATLASMSGEKIEAQLVALSQLPANFDLQQWVSLYMYGLALCAGYDPREFYPVSAGALGTATETETQHRKASSKGDLDFSLAHQEQLQNELPETILFEYEQRDVAGEISDIELQRAKVDLIDVMTHWQSSGQSVLTTVEIRQLAAQHGVIPQEWTEQEENVTGDDTFPEADTTLANERLNRYAEHLERHINYEAMTDAIQRGIHPRRVERTIDTLIRTSEQPLIAYTSNGRSKILLPRVGDIFQRIHLPKQTRQFVIRALDTPETFDASITEMDKRADLVSQITDTLADVRAALAREDARP